MVSGMGKEERRAVYVTFMQKRDSDVIRWSLGKLNLIGGNFSAGTSLNPCKFVPLAGTQAAG